MIGRASLLVRPFQNISARLWDLMAAAVTERRIVSGYRTRVHTDPEGTTINLQYPSEWPFAWSAIVSDERAIVARGTLNGAEPVMRDADGRGEMPLGQGPVLAITSGKFDDNGRGYIALEVTIDTSDYQTITKLEVVQCANLTTEKTEPTKGYFPAGLTEFAPGQVRYPLVRLVRQSGVVGYQQAYFDLQMVALPPQPNLQQGNNLIVRNKARYFFFPR